MANTAQLADRWGAAHVAALCVAFISVGQFLVAIGVVREDMSLMLLGRVLFGIGGESLCVAVSVLLQQVFAGAEVGLAMGLNLSVSRLGSVVNNIVSPYLARKTGSVVPALVFGGGLCITSLLATFVLVPLSGRLARGSGGSKREDQTQSRETSGVKIYNELRHIFANRYSSGCQTS